MNSSKYKQLLKIAYQAGESRKLDNFGYSVEWPWDKVLDAIDEIRKCYLRYKNKIEESSHYTRFDMGEVKLHEDMLVNVTESHQCKCVIKGFVTADEARDIKDEPAKIYFSNGKNITDLVNI